jgi:hypothetical protein
VGSAWREFDKGWGVPERLESAALGCQANEIGSARPPLLTAIRREKAKLGTIAGTGIVTYFLESLKSLI